MHYSSYKAGFVFTVLAIFDSPLIVIVCMKRRVLALTMTQDFLKSTPFQLVTKSSFCLIDLNMISALYGTVTYVKHEDQIPGINTELKRLSRGVGFFT